MGTGDEHMIEWSPCSHAGITFVLIGVFVAKASVIEMIVFAIGELESAPHGSWLLSCGNMCGCVDVALPLATGIIVGTVPEGLLVTLTVSLSLSARNMYARNVLVKVRQTCDRSSAACCSFPSSYARPQRPLHCTEPRFCALPRVAGHAIGGEPGQHHRDCF